MAISARSAEGLLGKEGLASFGYPIQSEVAGAERSSLQSPMVPEWERQFEGIDRQESELHQSQAKLMREQAHAIGRDMTAMRQEVLALKLSSNAVKADASSALDARSQELREAILQERREREAGQAALKEQLVSLERLLLQKQQDELATIRAQIKDTESFFGRCCSDLESRAQQASKSLDSRCQERLHMIEQELRRELDTERASHAASTTGTQQQIEKLQDRVCQCETLVKELKVESTNFELSTRRELQSQHGELLALVSQHTEEAKRANHEESAERERQFAGLSGRFEEIENDVRGRILSRIGSVELEIGKLSGSLEGECQAREQQCSSVWAKTEEALSAQQTSTRSLLERMEQFDPALDALGGRLDKALQAASGDLTRRIKAVEESQGSQVAELRRGLEERCRGEKTASQRLDGLEDCLASSADRHMQELSEVNGQLTAFRQSQSDATQRLQQGIAQVESRLGESVALCREQAASQLREVETRQAEALESSVKQTEGQFQEASQATKSQVQALRELQAAAADASLQSQKALQEQLEQLRQGSAKQAEQSMKVIKELKSGLENFQASTSKEQDKVHREQETLDAKLEQVSKTAKAALEECSASLRADLTSVRSSLDAFKGSSVEELKAATARISACEDQGKGTSQKAEAMSAILDQHSKELAETNSQAAVTGSHLKQVAGQLTSCEADLESLSRHAADERQRLKEELQRQKDLLDSLGETEVRSTRSALEQLEAAHSRLEEHGSALKELQGAHETLRSGHVSLESHHAALSTSVEAMASSQKTFEEGVKAASARQASVMDSQAARLAELQGNLKEVQSGVLEQLHSSVERVQSRVEQVQSGMEQSNAKLETQHGELLGQAQAAEKRLGSLEHGLSDQARALETSRSDAQDSVWSLRKATDAASAALKEGISALQAQVTAENAQYVERLDRFGRDQDDLEERHCAGLERLASLERQHGDEAKLRNDAVAELRSTQALHLQQLEAAQRALQTVRLEASTEKDTNDHQQQALQDLQRLVDEEREAREADQEALREQLSCEEEAREQHVAALQERLRAIDRSIEHSRQESVRSSEAQVRLTERVSASDERQTSLSEKLGRFEAKESLIQDAHEKLDELKRRIGRCEQHADWIGDVQRAQAHFESERTSLEADHAALRTRLGDLDSRISEAVSDNEKAVDILRSETTRLTKEIKLRESSQATLQDRVEHLETSVVSAVEQHSQELSESASRIERLQGRMASCEKLGGTCSEELRKAQVELGGSTSALKVHQEDLQERLSSLEQAQSDTHDRQGRALEGAEGRGRLVACERLAGPASAEVQALQAAWPKEKASLESLLSSVRERLDELEPLVGEAGSGHARALDQARAEQEQLRGRIAAAEQKQASAHAELRRLLEAELAGAQAALRERLTEALQQLPGLDERIEVGGQRVDALRERLEDSSRQMESLQAAYGQLAGEVSEAASRNIQLATLIAQEQEARSSQEATTHRSLSQLEATIAKELERQSGTLKAVRGVAEAAQVGLQEATPRLEQLGEDVAAVSQRSSEVKVRVDELGSHVLPLERQLQAQEEMLEGKLASERRARELKEAANEERLECERAAREMQRRELERITSRERQASERLTILERQITAVDELARREVEARTRESRRIWDAIDNHTHDLGTQVVELGGAEGDEEHDYEPFPCKPLAGLLRLGNSKSVEVGSSRGDSPGNISSPLPRRSLEKTPERKSPAR
eukprot:TRINITY_DN20911_c0_g1_i1.p1 TRINITY_DN20911_c0_g1~~TRINITY_DN20911_c0_g1_i1.p1  ORF type:complete len:1755 (-),score=534.96 TRINITY_DN20911_c0_g1_i1:94-5274(-)